MRGVQVIHVSNSFLTGKQTSIDGCGPLKDAHIDNHIDQGIEIGNGAAIAHARAFDPQFFGLTVDTLTGSSLGVDSVIKRTGAIQEDTLKSPWFSIGVFVAALPMIIYQVGTGLSSRRREDQWAAKALSLVAMGVLEEEARGHAQAPFAKRYAIAVTLVIGMTMLVPGHGSTTAMSGGGFIHIPCIKGCISGKVGRKMLEVQSRLMRERFEEGDVVLVEGLGELGENHIAILRGVAAATPEL